MKRLLFGVMCVAVLGVACSSPDVVATVNDSAITEQDVFDLHPGVNVLAEDFRDDLSRVIIIEAIRTRALVDYDVTVSDADVDAFLAEVPAEVVDTYLSTPRNTPETLAMDARSQVLRTRLIEELRTDPEVLAPLIAELPHEFVTACPRHILLETREEALGVIERLEAGEDWTVVAEVSADTATPEGVLPCSSPGGYVPAFREAVMTAPVGEVFGPVESSVGFHVMVVDSRTEVPDAETAAANGVLSADAASELFTQYLNDAIRTADIVVDSRIGTWDAIAFGITKPG